MSRLVFPLLIVTTLPKIHRLGNLLPSILVLRRSPCVPKPSLIPREHLDCHAVIINESDNFSIDRVHPEVI